MPLPCDETSDSATPNELTRWRIMETAWSIASLVTLPSSPGAIRGCNVTEVPPRRSRPKRTEVAPCTKTRAVIATTIRPRIAKVRTGRELVFIVLVFVDIGRESRRQVLVSRKAWRFPQVVFVLYGASPGLLPLARVEFWP